MRTTDALAIGMALGRIKGTLDAWEENKHPRADNGQFTSGAGGGGGSPKTQGNPRSTKGKLNVQGLKKVKELQRKSDELGKKLRRTYTHLSDSEKKTVNKAFEAARNGDAAEVKSLLKIDRDDAEHLTDLIKATDDHKQGQDITAAVFISQAFPTWYHKPGEKVNKAEMVTNMFKQEKKASSKPAAGRKALRKTLEKRPYEKLPNLIKRQADMIVEGIERDPVEYHKGKRTETVAKKYKEGKLSKEELQDEVTKLMLS